MSVPLYWHCSGCRFIQLAEENSRPAFESLESLVHAFGSVSMMLESTFFAIHSSFRAVLGVAENFGRMRGLLAQVFSALTIFRAVRWAAQRLLEILSEYWRWRRSQAGINCSLLYKLWPLPLQLAKQVVCQQIQRSNKIKTHTQIWSKNRIISTTYNLFSTGQINEYMAMKK